MPAISRLLATSVVLLVGRTLSAQPAPSPDDAQSIEAILARPLLSGRGFPRAFVAESDDPAAAAPAPADRTCAHQLRDERTGVVLILHKSWRTTTVAPDLRSVTIRSVGDYVASRPPSPYGERPGQRIRVSCIANTPLGIVPLD